MGTETGLNLEIPDDANGDQDGDGYNNIEEYLSELAGDAMSELVDYSIVFSDELGDFGNYRPSV